MKRLEKYLPKNYIHSIYDIDYKSLYNSGKRMIFFDLDNTIADYGTFIPKDEAKELFKKLEDMGFDPVILSNNKIMRVSCFSMELKCLVFSSVCKPFTHRVNRIIKDYNFKKNEIIWIGDQVMTDVLCANRLGIDVILVDPLDKTTEKWYTRFNRKIEAKVLKKIEKKYPNIFLDLGMDKR